jgi:hypothetical protein
MLTQLQRFLDGGDPDFKGLKGELEIVFGKFKSDQETRLLIEEIVHFQRST